MQWLPYATINELTVLSNLETHNAQMIREGKSKEERFQILKEIAEYRCKFYQRRIRYHVLKRRMKCSIFEI